MTAGVAYVVQGGLASGTYGASELAMLVDGDGADGRLGQGLAGGDLDGDGLSDLLITAPGRESNLGSVLLFSGQPVLDAMAVGR